MKQLSSLLAAVLWVSSVGLGCSDGGGTPRPTPALSAEDVTLVRENVPYIWSLQCAGQSNGTQVVYSHLDNDANGRCTDPASDLDCNIDLNTFDVALGTTSPLTETPFREFVFTVDGANIFWVYGVNNELWGANLAVGSQQSRPVDPLMGALVDLRASDARLAIVLGDLADVGFRVNLLDNLTATPEPISPVLPNAPLGFDFNGTWAVWPDANDDTNGDCFSDASDTDCFSRLMAYEVASGSTTEVAQGGGLSMQIPLICGDWVVFGDDRDDPDFECDPTTCIRHVTAVNARTLEEKRLFSDRLIHVPGCSGSRVVALLRSEDDENGRCFSDGLDLDCSNEVWMYNLATDERTYLLEGAPYFCPDVSGDRLTIERRPAVCFVPEVDSNCAGDILTTTLP